MIGSGASTTLYIVKWVKVDTTAKVKASGGGERGILLFMVKMIPSSPQRCIEGLLESREAASPSARWAWPSRGPSFSTSTNDGIFHKASWETLETQDPFCVLCTARCSPAHTHPTLTQLATILTVRYLSVESVGAGVCQYNGFPLKLCYLLSQMGSRFFPADIL